MFNYLSEKRNNVLHTSFMPICMLSSLPQHPTPRCLHCRCGDGWCSVQHLCHLLMQSTALPGKTAHMVGGFDKPHTQTHVRIHSHTVLLKTLPADFAENVSSFFLLTWNVMQTSPHLLLHAHIQTHTCTSVLWGVAGWRQMRQVWLRLVHHNSIALSQQSGMASFSLYISYTCSSTDLYSSSLNTWLLRFLWNPFFISYVDILWQQIHSGDSEH